MDVSDVNKIQKNLKSAEKIIQAVASTAIAAAALAPVADEIGNQIQAKVEKQKELIEIPSLYLKGFPIELDRAILRIEELGLKAEPISVRDAHIKYKDYMPSQVIVTKPKQNTKVDKGTCVLVKYVSSEIIIASKEMFAESEQKKEELKKEKAARKAEQQERNRKVLNKAASSVRDGVVNAASMTKNQIAKITPIRSKKKVADEAIDE